MKIYLRLLLCMVMLPTIIYSQAVNKGMFYIKPGSTVSVYYTLENQGEGDFKNNGELYLHRDLVNNGKIFDYKGNTPQGKTFLIGTAKQTIEGHTGTHFNTLILNNPIKERAFDIKTSVSIAGGVEFTQGIAKVDSLQGAFTFLNKSKVLHVSDASHIEGEVEKEGNEEFIYPKGDKGFYRQAIISAPKHQKDIFVGKYSLDDKQFFKVRKAVSGIVDKINTREYWLIEHSQTTTSNIVLTLTWDERTTPKEIYEHASDNLHILRWDAIEQLWVDEGGIVDLENKTVTTPTSLEKYGFFTLGTVRTDKMLKGDVVIYNFVSANGDGDNDYFRIDNIQRYPNNRVEIFNRWGVKVYETANYNSNGNVFRGYSDGRVTIKKNELLPTGTYFYIVSYEYKDDRGSSMIKETGYLHLEIN
ncbi:gliding motility-associated C-terminal domain-containing protein [Myroides odoratimimus]|uniref:gliding motility-associated C-terminal domain-containing protein n=1 Tax=Myroides odoratimimus TaxID=76832 RepID=UPI000280AAD8|nr:gliding motility-associated C-terminal domain-containing protein [Myroides odoratimimus]EKB04612.1 hypothetical protein HMPREF9711_01941 [Myroides odoratimimus CCUG 3837]MCS7473271.1 gliding motility-associated C-terminal domain-containing protein [Myroides odoratimimus]MDM1413908.1 gliding motility-associated C-terminal domain-containing protein [Myroides odoratimimus]MDM1446156.1 gliding motility-associated C-terminal domain-containing protein [Myroides odoratimimus]MDM1508400.1 gliding m